ncbi:hypothetical protein [Pedobacter antarcticus]|uniref:Uncharacterized protein n=2 Tax=Pedobacter antarcticus TaxID=34086 RepID=A0A081PBI4_9SPHI|nr:hypothetical protein [Pedobacter antarcticus]KEQ28057.1 hypothetical protein N180_20135 [Pedobacter antarcticus 4BY]SDL72847.1 hypothetical protein SAMN04488084_102260 [Pedobacter antarcticus]SFE85678.1 hypothetical protein SAMN03003324_01547 [Pedobacter antarcticus]
MNQTSLEITESEYCIKLNKESYDLSLVRQLIKRIQAEQFFFRKNTDPMDDDMIIRNEYHSNDSYDNLEDK